MSRERPILFSGPMVREILAGRKTQTRRPVKNLRVRLRHEIASDLPDSLPRSAVGPGAYAAEMNQHGAVSVRTSTGSLFGVKPQEFDFVCPYADGHTYLRKHPDGRMAWHLQVAPGEQRLWVREAFAPGGDIQRRDDLSFHVRYRADAAAALGAYGATKWKPGIHMPRWASRLLLEVEAVRVERLQAITEEDARAEGMTFAGGYWLGAPHRIKGTETCWPTAREALLSRWDTMYGGGDFAVERNPWVWAVTFRRVDAARSAA